MTQGVLPDASLKLLDPALVSPALLALVRRRRADARDPLRGRRPLRARERHAHAGSLMWAAATMRASSVIAQWAEISDRAGEIVPAYGFTQAEREVASAHASGAAMMRAAVIVVHRAHADRSRLSRRLQPTPAPTLAAHALKAAVARAGVAPAEVEDCLLGCSLPQGTQHTIGRMAALRAGLPVEVPGMTLDRQCSSGLMTIATAAKQIIVDRMDIVVAGGVESISLVQTPALRIDPDPALVADASGRRHADDRDRRGGGDALRHFARAHATPTRCPRSNAPPLRRRRGASTLKSSRAARP